MKGLAYIGSKVGSNLVNFVQDFKTDLYPDGACSGLTLTVINANSIKADWVVGSTNETGIVAEISANQTTWIETALAAEAITNTFTGLDPETLYYVRIKSVKGTYYLAYTTIESATTASE